MWIGSTLVIFVLLGICQTQDVPDTTTSSSISSSNKTSDFILQMMEHFKSPDPLGLPGSAIQDPQPIPDVTKILPIGTIYFEEMAIHGTNKFRILYIDTDVITMEVRAGMAIEKLQTRGNYTYCSFLCFDKVQGPFTVDAFAVKITGVANIGVNEEGKLRAKNIKMEIEFETLKMNFQNLNLLGSVIQSFMNGLSSFLFDSIKPYILEDSYENMRKAINEQLDQLIGDIQFPNTITPLDMIFIDTRIALQEKGMDPYKCDDHHEVFGLVSINLTKTMITGLSSLHRTGNITCRMENGTVATELDIGFKRLEGRTHWCVSALNGLIANSGTASFSVESITAKIAISQALDIRKKPILLNLKFDIGNIQTRWDGIGIIDYLIEFLVNILPNLLRYQLTYVIEGHVKTLIQMKMNDTDMEETIRQELPRIDELQEAGFKLSMLRKERVRYSEDDFFNF